MSLKKKQIQHRDRLKQKADALLGYDIEVSPDVIAIMDPDLNYIFANTAACRLLTKKKEELEGNNLLQMFPALTASPSHRFLLAAASGETVLDAISEGNITKDGAQFLTNYYPFMDATGVYAIVSVTKSLYFPK